VIVAEQESCTKKNMKVRQPGSFSKGIHLFGLKRRITPGGNLLLFPRHQQVSFSFSLILNEVYENKHQVQLRWDLIW